MKPVLLPAAVTLLTGAMLTAEVLQTITMSLQAFSRNAFFVISIALLGLGCGGSLTAWRAHRGPFDPLRWLWGSAVGFAVASLVCAVIVSRQNSVLPLMLASVPPYIFAGTFLGVLFGAWPERTPQLYFFDLIGSALGCLGVVWLLSITGSAPAVVILLSSLAFSSAALVGALRSRRHVVLPIAGALSVLSLLPIADTLLPYAPAVNKHYGSMLANPEMETTREWSQWNYLGRLDVVRPGVGADRFEHGELAAEVMKNGCDFRYLFASGDNWSYAIGFAGNDGFRDQFIRGAAPSSAYDGRPGADVLIIGIGGGVDVFLALSLGAARVTAVDINPSMVEAVKNLGSGYWSGLFDDPRLTIRQIDGRTWVDTSAESYDVITLTAVDTGAGLVQGGMMLSENYLYTEEAFDRYLAALKPGGVLYVLRPDTPLLRTLATAAGALSRRGVETPEDHFAVFGSTWTSALIFRDPIPADGALALRNRLAAGDFGGGLRYLPGGVERNHDRFTRFFEALRRDDLESFHRENEGAYEPVDDDRPFFYLHSPSLFASDAGKTLLEILLWVTLIALVLLFLPLRGIRTSAPGVLAPSLLYFSGIGLGFMFIEIGLMQKLALFLGHPARSVTVTLFGVLIFTGIGSLWSSRFAAHADRTVTIALPIVALLALLYAWTLGPALSLVDSTELLTRVIIALAALAPGAFTMGMCFPLGVQLLARRSRTMVPWAWAVNAFASVIGSVVATMVAMSVGFSSLLLCGAGCYIISLLGHMAGNSSGRTSSAVSATDAHATPP